MVQSKRLLTPTSLLVCSSACWFLLTAIIGIWASYEPAAALRRFGLLVFALAMMLGIAWTGRLRPETTLGSVGLGCSLLSAVIGLSFLFGIVQNSGMIASGLMVLIPLVIGAAIWQHRSGKQQFLIVEGVCILLAVVSLVLSQERTAWLGLAIGGGFAAWVTWRFAGKNDLPRKLWDVALALGLGLAILGGSVILSSSAYDHYLANLPFSGVLFERLPLWRASLSLVDDFQFSGSGLGSTAMIFSTYAYLVRVPFFYHAHNLYLQIALEQGLPGLLAFLCLALPLVISLVKLYRVVNPHARPFVLLTLWAMMTTLTYGLFDAELFATWLVPLLFLPFSCALLLHWAAQYTVDHPTSTQEQWGFPVGRLGWCAVAPLIALVVMLGQPYFPARLHANLGAVAQAKAELGLFNWDEWHLQDEVRRDGHANLSSAMQHYEAALALDPANVTAHERLGQIALANSDYQTALRHLQAVYAVAPQREAARQMLGEVFAVNGELGQAVALWRTVNLEGDKLADREWWYNHLGNQHQEEAKRIRQVIARVTS